MEKKLAKINNVNIIQIDNDLIPIKPICEALGISSNKQIEKLKSDDFFNSVGTLRVSTGKDKKEYEMYCLPIKYIFGWLCTINPKNVNEEAKESVILYKEKCYNILYDNLFLQQIFLKEKEKQIEEKLEELESIRENFKNAKYKLEEANASLKEIRNYDFEKWKQEKNQTSMTDVEGFNQ